MLVDRHGRRARYLRVSVTDRCNFRCLYCRSADKERPLAHERILRYEEALRVIDIAVAAGIAKVRVTGGEPFMRKDCDAFLVMLKKRHPELALAVTSNGSLLEPHIPLLRALGVSSVNLSLDAFDREVFARITGRDELATVLGALDRLLRAGLKVKLNAVALRGITEGQLDDFLHAARTMPVDVRFIELMPLGGNAGEALFWPVEEVRAAVTSRVRLLDLPEDGHDAFPGPARMFGVEHGQGRIGFIAAASDHACARCNRLRLTSDGALRTCLFSGREYRLAGLLRHRCVPDEIIARVLRRACEARPLGETLLKAGAPLSRGKRPMNALGG